MSVAIRRSLYGKLSGDTTLSSMLGTPAPGRNKAIYHEEAPKGASFPLIVFSKSSGTPSYSLANRAFDNEVWLVKAIDKTDNADTADNIAERINALLTDGSISISGHQSLYLRRTADVEYPERDGDTTYRHSGALYRLIYD